MTKLLVSGPRFTGDGYAMGDMVPAPATAPEIVFYNLQVTVETEAFIDLPGSGVYTGYHRIADFIGDIETAISSSSFPTHSTLYNGAGDEPYDIVVKHPCYVVIAISSDDNQTLTFQDDVPALKTAEDRSSRYRGLTRADSELSSKLVYFEVFHPGASGDDPYNLYLQYDGDLDTVRWTVDPKIKNRGTRGVGTHTDKAK